VKAVPHLEIHVTHACNLACESCTHYSDQGHKGAVSVDEADRWMAAWSGRIAPTVFSLLGGEPTIHPDLAEFVLRARWHFPEAALRIVTNGFFLHRHPTLPGILARDRDVRLYLSVHHDAPAYRAKLQPAMELLREWVAAHGIKVEVYPSQARWTRQYLGSGAAMMPYEDGKPRESWKACRAKDCPQLFERKLWKCSPLAYLGMQDAKYGLNAKWKPYLGYEALAADCSDAQLDEFFAREEESHCGMCPARPEHFALSIPIRALAHQEP
jgi:hypothetical protein